MGSARAARLGIAAAALAAIGIIDATPIAAAAQPVGLQGSLLISCSRTFTCAAIRGLEVDPCPDEIGGARSFQDRPLFLVHPRTNKAELIGGAEYFAEIRPDIYRLTRRKDLGFATIQWESGIDPSTGALSGQIRLYFADDGRLIEFQYHGACLIKEVEDTTEAGKSLSATSEDASVEAK